MPELKLTEGIQTNVPVLDIKDKDEELIARINKAIASVNPDYEKTSRRAKQNRKYWLGEQIDESKLKDHQAKIVNNLMFRNMETMLPVITQNTPTPKIISSNKPYAKSLQKILVNCWEVQDQMLDKNRKSVRANFLDLLGVIKYRYDVDSDEVVYEFVKTRNLMIDKSPDVESINFVAEFIDEFTLTEVLNKYPKKKKELLKDLGILETDYDKLGSKLTYVEFHTPEISVWKCGNVILDKSKNANWDWGNSMETDENGITNKVSYNLWKKPRVPYIFFSTFSLGESLFSDTSFIEQTIKLQDSVNKRKRQISDNADEANGTLIGSGDGISKDEFSKIDDEPNLKIWISSGNINNVIGRVQGNMLPQYVYQDMMHSETAVDDLWGTHAITRGASSGEATATQDVLQQKQDYGRIDDIVKAYEDFNEQYYQSRFQMMLVHYTEPHTFSFDDEDDLEITRDDIIKEFSKTIVRKTSDIVGQTEEVTEGKFRPPIIMVKRGSTLPTDDMTTRNEAIALAKMGKISDIDLYEQLDYPNAKEMAYRAFLQLSAPQQLYAEFAANPEQETSQGAIEDFQAITQGQEVPVNPEISDPKTAIAHIEAHKQMLDSQDFQSLDPQLQQLFINHLKAEVAATKEMTAQPMGQEMAPEAEGIME